MDVMRVLRGPRALPRWAVASLVANIGIVVTGGLVRLTGSGLGCPTWPRCTAESFVAHPALGIYGAIEFGNRLLTFVLIIIAVLTFFSALVYRDPSRTARGGRRRDLFWLSGGLALGIPAQAIIGGISVLYQLNPYIVSAHLLVSMILISLSVWLVRLTWLAPRSPVGAPMVILTRVIFAGMWVVLLLGTLVTGSGPHAGDADVARNGLSGLLVTRLHAGAVYVTVALTIVAVARLRSRRRVPAARGRGRPSRHRHLAVPARPAGRTGRRPPARRVPGHGGRREPDALGPADQRAAAYCGF